MKKAICFLLTAVASLTLCFALTACGGGEEETYTVYFGLNDADTGEQAVSVEDASLVIRGVIIAHGMGYTEYVAYGAYVEGGVVYGNDTLVYSLVFTDKETVLAIVNEAKEQLNLASVMIESGRAAFEFVGEGEEK